MRWRSYGSLMCERSHASLAVHDIISSFQHVAVVAKETGCNVMPPSLPLTKGAWSCAHHHRVFNLTRPPRPEEESSAFLQISLSPASERKEHTFFQSKRKLQSPQLLQIQHLLSRESADMARRNQNATKGTLQRKKKHSCSSSFSAPPPFFVANGL